MNDLNFALRQLLMNPGFTVVAVLTLALGIEANLAVVSPVDSLFFRPLPGLSRPGRLVVIGSTYRAPSQVSYSVFSVGFCIVHFLLLPRKCRVPSLQRVARYAVEILAEARRAWARVTKALLFAPPPCVLARLAVGPANLPDTK